jgi:phosphatidylglycerophosphate synthase
MNARLVRTGALVLGIVLFCGALYYINLTLAIGTIRRLGVGVPLALLVSGLWHLTRTWAWAWCFPDPRAVGFLRLARVRLAAEAFSYLTLRGIAGEPLKVVLLADRVGAREATAAVALERLAYLVGTCIIVGIGSLAAMLGLPLTGVWFRVFRAFAIAAALIAAFTALVISGHGTYVASLLRRMDGAFGTSLAGSRAGGFVTAVEAQILELVRGNPKRLLALVTATVLSYVLMSLEAWVILRASGVPISPNGALAAETFSRVASFGSAFIPANLGALEAMSLAAAAAVGVPAGGAALAIVRRIRGLFWAGVGLAIYPRGIRPAQAAQSREEQPAPDRPARTLLFLPFDSRSGVEPTARLAGLPLVERVIRSAARAGYTRILVWTRDAPPRTVRSLQRLERTVAGVQLLSSRERWCAAVEAQATPPVLVAIGSGTVVSPALLESAAAPHVDSDGSVDVPAGASWPHSGVLRVPREIAADPERLSTELRRGGDPARPLPSGEDVADGRARLALRIGTPGELQAAEGIIRRATYKTTDNTLARFNRRISLPISVALIRTPLTANQLSVSLVAIGFYSAWLFSLGHYWTGVLGAFLSLAASILDGCDGEIARLKYQESALGCWIETFGDYAYYVAIFIGLTIGAARQTHAGIFYWIGGLALAGTLLTFVLLVYLRSRITAGRPERLHAIAAERFKAEPTFWSRLIWRLSFTATRSAMPYGIFAFALMHALPAIVVLAAIGSNIYWISLVWKLRALMGGDGQLITTNY